MTLVLQMFGHKQINWTKWSVLGNFTSVPNFMAIHKIIADVGPIGTAIFTVTLDKDKRIEVEMQGIFSSVSHTQSSFRCIMWNDGHRLSQIWFNVCCDFALKLSPEQRKWIYLVQRIQMGSDSFFLCLSDIKRLI